jgi:hypothetical protein
MFFCLDKKCKSHLWKRTLMSLRCLVQRVHISSKPDWWFGCEFDGRIKCTRKLESVNSHQVWKHSFLTELHFLSNRPSHFLCGHHWTLFLNKISLEGPHQVSSKVSSGLCSWQINETWKTTLDVSKDSEYYIFAIWLIAKSLILNPKSGVRL